MDSDNPFVFDDGSIGVPRLPRLAGSLLGIAIL